MRNDKETVRFELNKEEAELIYNALNHQSSCERVELTERGGKLNDRLWERLEQEVFADKRIGANEEFKNLLIAE